MYYFSQFPKVPVPDFNNNLVLLTNLLTRVNVIPDLLNNPMLFYSYDIQEGDTPDIIATKYYGDPNRYWLVLFANQILDPQWQWPLTSQQMNDYLTDRYASAAAASNVPNVISYCQQTVFEYRKQVTTKDSNSRYNNVTTMRMDPTEYQLFVPSTVTQAFADGHTVTKTIKAYGVSIYDRQNEINEAKRKINLINSSYVGQIEKQFSTLMKL
jgi:hypothetical protein